MISMFRFIEEMFKNGPESNSVETRDDKLSKIKIEKIKNLWLSTVQNKGATEYSNLDITRNWLVQLINEEASKIELSFNDGDNPHGEYTNLLHDIEKQILDAKTEEEIILQINRLNAPLSDFRRDESLNKIIQIAKEE